VLVLSLICE